eukprot:CAMPEP_0194584708 /NCGR_PEP_ID=MMETSP0292-20121207/17223_1 /TAXON_ID=39354 /ORGANISM="Heterosigma akashiwo, Strain CCMP2393" /LENGTH=215 /DNA_ID=CAMNT_0039439827 /DNA_START=574 /DNA_END=1221 /DNA_ORIENTATION=-
MSLPPPAAAMLYLAGSGPPPPIAPPSLPWSSSSSARAASVAEGVRPLEGKDLGVSATSRSPSESGRTGPQHSASRSSTLVQAKQGLTKGYTQVKRLPSVLWLYTSWLYDVNTKSSPVTFSVSELSSPSGTGPFSTAWRIRASSIRRSGCSRKRRMDTAAIARLTGGSSRARRSMSTNSTVSLVSESQSSTDSSKCKAIATLGVFESNWTSLKGDI